MFLGFVLNHVYINIILEPLERAGAEIPFRFIALVEVVTNANALAVLVYRLYHKWVGRGFRACLVSLHLCQKVL